MSTRQETATCSSSVTQQMLIEHELLRQIGASLRTILGWNPSVAGTFRRLDSLHFLVGSLYRHLDRLMSLEEQDGYMPQLTRRQPHLIEKVNRLRQQHDQFRKELGSLVQGLEPFPSDDALTVDLFGDRLDKFLMSVETHSTEEIRLVQEAYLRDEGGEG